MRTSGAVDAPALTVDPARTRAALEAASRQAAALIRAIPDPTRPIPNSDWTVGDAAAHMALAADVYADCAEGRESPITDLGDLAAFNARFLAEHPERRCAALADALLAAEGRLLTATASRRGDEFLPFHEGAPAPLGTVLSVALAELLTHGYDIARALGRPWPIRPEHARLAMAGVSWLLPRFVEERAARGVRASYDVRLRGGTRMTFRFDNGTLAVLPGGSGPVDAHILADPVAFLLVGYGRISQWGPIFKGQILAWGRKPWLALTFKRLLRNP